MSQPPAILFPMPPMILFMTTLLMPLMTLLMPLLTITLLSMSPPPQMLCPTQSPLQSLLPVIPSEAKAKPKESELPFGHPLKFLADKNLTLHDATDGKKLGDLMVSFSRFDAVPDDDYEPLPHDTIVVNANKYAQVKGCSLINGGANGVLCGSDMKLIADTDCMVSILGIANHVVEDNHVGTYIGIAHSHLGKVLVYVNEGAGVPTQKTPVLSKIQMSAYSCTVDDTSILHGGKQVLVTKCGHCFPLELHNGLCYLDITYPTEEEECTLNTVILTSDDKWDPSKYNDTVSVR